MKLTVNVPTVLVECAKCRARSRPVELVGSRIGAELPCHCPIAEPVLAFYAGNDQDRKTALATVRLESPS